MCLASIGKCSGGLLYCETVADLSYSHHEKLWVVGIFASVGSPNPRLLVGDSCCTSVQEGHTNATRTLPAHTLLKHELIIMPVQIYTCLICQFSNRNKLPIHVVKLETTTSFFHRKEAIFDSENWNDSAYLVHFN